MIRMPEYLLVTGVDQCIQKFLDVARQIECFFLQKRFQLSVQKPEQVVKEVNDPADFAYCELLCSSTMIQQFSNYTSS